jgi:uncharacterized membrane protein
VVESAPPQTVYHRWLGFHAPALRRLALAAALGLVVGLLLVPFERPEIAVLVGWDVCAATILVAVWHVISIADSTRTKMLAMREDETRGSARLLLLNAAIASLFAVGFMLGAAGRVKGGAQVLYIAIAIVTVVVSWTIVNTVFTLRYADLYFTGIAEGIDFGGATDEPDFRDFAYLAFTIGMTYQVSDTNLRNRSIRRYVLQHAFMSYGFGVVIVSTMVSLVANLIH